VRMVVVSAAADRLSQILNIRKLAAGGGGCEVLRQLRQLSGLRRVAVGLGRLRSGLQVIGNLLGHLLILSWVRLLKLLQRAQKLREGRQLAAVGRDASRTTGAG